MMTITGQGKLLLFLEHCYASTGYSGDAPLFTANRTSDFLNDTVG